MINIPDSISAIVLKGFDDFKSNDILTFIYYKNDGAQKYYLKGGFIFNYDIIDYECVLELIEMKRKI